jgi:chlorite dismutase
MGTTEDESKNSTYGSLRLAPATDDTIQPKSLLPRQFVSFTFHRVRPEWRLLEDGVKEQARQEFANALEEFRRDLLIHTYSLVGLRTNAEFMTWRIGYQLDSIQEMTARLNHTQLGKYMETTQSFLSMTKRSMYIDKDNPEHVEDRLHIIPGKSKYLFVYPFVKTREWYAKPSDARQEMMDEHIRIGSKNSSSPSKRTNPQTSWTSCRSCVKRKPALSPCAIRQCSPAASARLSNAWKRWVRIKDTERFETKTRRSIS